MKQKFKMPTAYTILISITIIVAALTWIIPAGSYEYLDSTKQPVPGTYQMVDSNPQGLWEVINAPISGFGDARSIALFVLVIGGFLGIIMKTGAVDAGIGKIISRLKGNEKLMIPILMVAFALGGTSYGMAEETIAFYPLLIPIFIAAGYDTIVAVSTILLGAGIGVLNSTVNPFATGVASGFAGVSVGDGVLFRVIMLVIQLSIAILFVMKYAEKVKKNNKNSLVAEQSEENKNHFLGQEDKGNEIVELTGRRKAVLIIFVLTFIIMIIGVIPWSWKFNINIFDNLNNIISKIPGIGNPVALGDWWFQEITVLFLVSSILCGKVYGLKEKEIINSFVAGARDLLGVALIIGVSRGITVIMNAGGMTETVLYWGESTLAGLGQIPFILFTYLFYMPLSFLIPSTSGLATLSMPIMAPLGEFAGVNKSLVVTAYQSASGIVNLVAPTSAVVMGGLSLARVDYSKWLKYALPLIGILFLINSLGLAIASIL